MPPSEVRRIDEAAAKSKLTRSAWIRRALWLQVKCAAGPDWAAHWKWFHSEAAKNGAVRGHPEDEIIALRR